MQLRRNREIEFIGELAQECSCKVYVVGGCVRDSMMGREASDIDFVVFGDIDEFARRVIKHYRCPWVLYEKRLRTYRLFSSLGTIDLSSPRGNTIEEDLRLRDITINSMAYDPSVEELIDPTGGAEDIKNKIVKMTSDTSFVDDPVRILRVFRFAALFRFSIDTKTLLRVKDSSYLLKYAAGERITDELKKFFLLEVTFPYLIMMDNSGVLGVLFREIEEAAGCIQSNKHLYDVKTHSLNVYNFVEWYLERLPKVLGDCAENYLEYFGTHRDSIVVAMKLAALLHDTGKPEVKIIDGEGLVHFPGHEEYGLKILNNYRSVYSFGKEVYDLAGFLIARHIEPANIYLKWREGSLSREDVVDFFMDKHLKGIDLLLFSLADTLAKGKVSRIGRERSLEFLRFMCREYFDFFKPAYEKPGFVNGYDVIEHVTGDRRKVGLLLREAKRAQILGLVKNREETISYLRSLVL